MPLVIRHGRFCRLFASMAIILIGWAGSGLAQQQSAAGQWRCQHASQSRNNNPFDTWTYQFVLDLNPNQTFQVQGSYMSMSAGFAVNMRATGQWQQGANNNAGGAPSVFVQGQEQRQDGTTLPFILLFSNVTDTVMSNSHNGPLGALLTHCQRQ